MSAAHSRTTREPTKGGSRRFRVETKHEDIHLLDSVLVVLDEVICPRTLGWIRAKDVVEAIQSRARGLKVIATGRGAFRFGRDCRPPYPDGEGPACV